MWGLMVHESYRESQENYILIYFWMPLKIEDINAFLSSFSSKLILITSHNCICNFKSLLLTQFFSIYIVTS